MCESFQSSIIRIIFLQFETTIIENYLENVYEWDVKWFKLFFFLDYDNIVRMKQKYAFGNCVYSSSIAGMNVWRSPNSFVICKFCECSLEPKDSSANSIHFQDIRDSDEIERFSSTLHFAIEKCSKIFLLKTEQPNTGTNDYNWIIHSKLNWLSFEYLNFAKKNLFRSYNQFFLLLSSFI